MKLKRTEKIDLYRINNKYKNRYNQADCCGIVLKSISKFLHPCHIRETQSHDALLKGHVQEGYADSF